MKDKETLERKMLNLNRPPGSSSAGPSRPPTKADHEIESLKSKNFKLQEEVRSKTNFNLQ